MARRSLQPNLGGWSSVGAQFFSDREITAAFCFIWQPRLRLTRRKGNSMTTEPKVLLSLDAAYVLRYATGISDVQARELITIFGHDLSSLIREAQLLQKPAI